MMIPRPIGLQHRESVEALEPRIAPAAVFVNSSTARCVDKDGDTITVKFSKGILTKENVDEVLVENGNGLERIYLAAGNKPSGVGFSVSVAKAETGNGLCVIGADTVSGPAQGIEVSADGKTARFLDTDGDLVTVKFSRSVLTAENAKTVLVVTDRGLEKVDTSGLIAGVTYSVTTAKSVLGDGISGVAGETAATAKPLYVSSSRKSASYMDTDGDMVTVAFSRAVLSAEKARLVLDLGPSGLERVDLSEVGGSDFSLSARKSLTGNGTFGFGKTETTAKTVYIDPGGKLARYIDPDGDLVTVTFSKSVITPENASRVLFSDEKGLQGVNLNEAANAAGVSYTVQTTRGRAANGRISIGATEAAAEGAPAAAAPTELMDGIFLNSTGTAASFVDVDGDWVSVALGRGLFTTQNVETIVQRGEYGLNKLDLKTAMGGRSGVDVSVSVAKSMEGDARLKVGFVDGSDTNFGHLKLAAVDVGRILAGNGRWTGTIEAPAYAKEVYDLIYSDERLEREPVGVGRGGVEIYAPAAKSVELGAINPSAMGLSGADRLSEFFGDVPKFVSGDVVGAKLRLDGSVPVFVCGSIKGESENYSGSVYFRGRAPASIEVKGDILGGSAQGSGVLQIGYESSFYADGELAKAPARGDIIVRGSIVGGTGPVNGPVANDTGGIDCGFNRTAGVKSITVKGNIQGGVLNYEVPPRTPAGLDGFLGQGPGRSGFIYGSRIGKIRVEGDIIGGTNNTQYAMFGTGPGVLVNGKPRGIDYGVVGGIKVNFVESIYVAGEMRGTLGAKGLWTDATIVMAGTRTGQDQDGFDYVNFPNAKKIEVVGGFTRATIFGNSVDGVIDEIKIGGNLVASNILIGLDPGQDVIYGTSDDFLSDSLHETGKSRIGSIVVGGTLNGSADPNEVFAVQAKQIGKVVVGGVAFEVGEDRIERGNLVIKEVTQLNPAL